MPDKQPSRWSRVPKMSFSSKDLSRRMKKVEGATLKHARRFVFRRWSNFKEVRRHIALWVLMVGLLIGASGLQLFWYQQSYRTMAAASDGTYAEGVVGPVETLNPIFARSSAEESLSRLVFSRLLTYDASGKLNFDLAEKMTLSEDQRTYIVTIRPDARWHDGLYVRAKDVVFTVNTLKDPATRASITGWGDIRVAQVDERTVSFTLPVVYAAFPHALSSLPILPEHKLRDVAPSALRENAFSASPTGSGPFTFRFLQTLDQNKARKIVYLARNDSYYKGAPKLERLQLHAYESSEEIIRALAISEVNAATDMALADISRVNQERYTVTRTPVNNGVYALFNTTRGVLADIQVRRALQVGTNTAELRTQIGEGTPALWLPFIPGQVAGNVPTEPVFDPARAGQILDEAGWVLQEGVRVKDGQRLNLSVVTTKNSDLEKALGILQDQWRDLGLTVTTNIVDPSDPTQNVSVSILQPRNYDVLVNQLSIGGDPDVYAYWHSSQASRGFNFSNYSNSIADDALLSARSVIAADLRDAKYVTFAQQWMADAPALGLYQVTSQYARGKSVATSGQPQIWVTASDRYSDVLYWTVGERIVYRTP